MTIDPATLEHCNEVRLVGRIADEPEVRTLPSGDEIVTARLVVKRPPPTGDRPVRPSVDTVACTAWAGQAQQSLRGHTAGDVVEIRGALRRRFWRSPTGLNNTFEVEVESISAP